MRVRSWGLVCVAVLLVGCPDTDEKAGEALDVIGPADGDGAAGGGDIIALPADLGPAIDPGPAGVDIPEVEDAGPSIKEFVPCTENGDCPSGWCLESADGKTCTETCIDSCPKEWFCGEVTNTGQDVTWICLPRFVTLCRPCLDDAECAGALGASGASCLDYGPEGRFCGAECDEGAPCPEGYQCQADAESGPGQCRRTSGECECSWKAIKDGAKTVCSAANELGTCSGGRSCLDGTLSACDAPTPSAEVCDGVDNDCDDALDEETGGAGCEVVSEYGACAGVLLCDQGALSCDAPTPELEICDGKDNDCDGDEDETYPDSNDDGLADCVSPDDDGDGVLDTEDNCPVTPNPDQSDADQDGVGDLCDVDSDGDGDPDVTDCAPGDPAVGAKNVESCNGVDDDCDALLDETFPDLDQDGVADCVDSDDDGDAVADLVDNCPVTANPEQTDADGDGKGDACDADKDEDGDPDLTDCAPLDPAVHHGAAEECNGADENCNGIIDEGNPDTDGDGVADCLDTDDDGDGVADTADSCPLVKNPEQTDVDQDGAGDACDSDDDGDGDPDALDCAPLDPAVSHKATEVCNGKDDDCDSLVDEADAVGCQAYFFDDDGDGHGLDGVQKCLCGAEPPYSAAEPGDCNDKNPQVFPGADEVCNLKDDDCDESVDEGAAIGCQDAYADGDGDGYGAGGASCVCPGAGGFAPVAGDCADDAAQVHPGALEKCNGGVDDDCNELADEAGAFGCEKHYRDVDEDGFGLIADGQCLCGPEGVYTAKAFGDCADDDDEVFPGKVEACDEKDNNCNGQIDEGVQTTFYVDDDEDGFGASYNTVDACAARAGYVTKGGDCNDFNGAISPGTAELCDSVDNDCDGLEDEDLPLAKVYVDLDGDGHGAAGTAGIEACLLDVDGDGTGETSPDGFSLAADDCNDSAAIVYPGAPELCDTVLNDCQAPVADYHCATQCDGEWPVLFGVTVGWPQPVQLDSTNPLEVVAQGSGTVVVLNHDGTVKWQAGGSTTYSYPVTADVNLDGTMDVVVFESNQVRVLNGADGSALESYSVPSTGYRQGVVFDLDNDGHVDLAAPSSGSVVAVVLRNGQGGAKQTLLLQAPSGTYFNGDVPAAADLDGDGVAELIVGTGYYTCNDGNAPGCNAQLLVYSVITGQLVFDPETDFAVPDALNAYAGGPWPVIADFDNDGENEVFHAFGNKATGTQGFVWNLDGTPSAPAAGPMNTTPRLSPVDEDGVLDPDGALHDIAGGVIDLDGDGVFEVVKAQSSGIWILQDGEVMDGYPLAVAGAGHTVLTDIDRDGRLDVLFVGQDNASVNCYTLGQGTYSPGRLLTGGSIDALGGGKYHTSAFDPYEPNDKAAVPFDPAAAIHPITDSRAFPLRGFRDTFSSSSGWSRSLVAALATHGDRDYYWATGSQISVSLQTLVGPADYDLHVHMYRQVAGAWQFVSTWSSESVGADVVTCTNSMPCPDAANKGTKTFIIEVRPHDPDVDYGPWPYRLRIAFGAG